MKELRRRGKRITRQREILVDVILGGQWKCCKEIYYAAKERDPSIGIATVYRMVSTLEEIGALNRSYSYLLLPAGQEGNVAVVGSCEPARELSREFCEEFGQFLEGRGILDTRKQKFSATIVIDG